MPIDSNKRAVGVFGEDTPFASEAVNLYEVKPKPPSAPSFSVSPAATTPQRVAEMKSLPALLEALKSFDGCSLKTTALNTVFARGSDEPDVFFVGEAPGADEDRLGEPFVGRSGKLLDEMLTAAGLGMDKVRIGNILPWRPPGNRTPTPEEVATCLPFIERHIELAAPKIVAFLGGVAAHALLGSEEPISRLRRRWHTFETPRMSAPIAAKPTFHPSYLLRSPGQKKWAWGDMLEIAAKLEE